MKSINKLACTLSLCTIILTAANYAKADFWRWTKPFKGPYQKIQTLIVTGNYAESRLLAELIQVENRQPILLMPSVNDERIFFMPPQKSAQALEVPYSELTNFVSFLGAKQILILGNKNYVPEKYTDRIPGNQVIWRISGDNWKKIAASMGRFLNLTNLSSDYNSLADKMKSEINYKRVNQQTEAEEKPVLVEETEDLEIIPITEEPVITPEPAKPAKIEVPKPIDASVK